MTRKYKERPGTANRKIIMANGYRTKSKGIFLLRLDRQYN